MRFAICDDMKIFVESFSIRLEEILLSKKITDVQIDKFTCADMLVSKLVENVYDTVFLDIEMPKQNGFQIARQIKLISPKTLIVFITNCDNLVFDAMKIHPYSFIRKDYIDKEINAVICDIIAEIYNKGKSIAIKEDSVIYNVPIDDILYFESARNFIIIHAINNTYKQRASLINFEKDLSNYGFVRVHSGFLINLFHVYSMESDGVKLSNGEIVPVSRSLKKQTKEAIIKRMVHK